MSRPRVLAIIQAGGAGGRMDVLTRERAKPALPFAGVYQLVDFPLSNLAHSGVTDVWLSLQFQGATLEETVANGRPWDLDRDRGGLRLLMPEQGTGSLDEEGFAQGNGDELFRIRAKIAYDAPDAVVVLSADHVYRLDYTAVVDAHLASGAECTIVTTEVPIEEAGDHAVVVAGDDDRVTDFAYKPEDPKTGTIAAEIIVYDPAVLVSVLEELHRELGADSDAGDSGLGDFGDHLVPRLVERGATYAWGLEGYWRDVGQPHHYLQAHQDVLTDDLGILAEPGWPILTRQPQRVPGAGARRRAGRGQPAQPRHPRRGHRRPQRDRARRGRRGRQRGPRQRGLRRHRGARRVPRALVRGRHRLRGRAGRAGRGPGRRRHRRPRRRHARREGLGGRGRRRPRGRCAAGARHHGLRAPPAARSVTRIAAAWRPVSASG